MPHGAASGARRQRESRHAGVGGGGDAALEQARQLGLLRCLLNCAGL